MEAELQQCPKETIGKLATLSIKERCPTISNLDSFLPTSKVIFCIDSNSRGNLTLIRPVALYSILSALLILDFVSAWQHIFLKLPDENKTIGR